MQQRAFHAQKSSCACLPHVLDGQQPLPPGPQEAWLHFCFWLCSVTCHPHFLLSPECVTLFQLCHPVLLYKRAPSPCLWVQLLQPGKDALQSAGPAASRFYTINTLWGSSLHQRLHHVVCRNSLGTLSYSHHLGKFLYQLELSCVRLFMTPWTAAHQAPLSMEFFQARILE